MKPQGNPKFNNKQRADIRKEYRRSNATQAELAAKYGVSLITIGRIVRRKNKQDS